MQNLVARVILRPGFVHPCSSLSTLFIFLLNNRSSPDLSQCPGTVKPAYNGTARGKMFLAVGGLRLTRALLSTDNRDSRSSGLTFSTKDRFLLCPGSV